MDPLDLREAIPALDGITYLNTGAASPAPRPVVEAVTDRVEHHQYVAPAAEGMYPALFAAFDDARESVADVLGAAPDEIALTRSTADGINRIATALPWEAGDVVVRTDCEHPAGILPWERLADRHGIETRVVETTRGRLDRDRLTTALDGAALLCLSSITWNYGTRLPIAEAVAMAHDAGARVLVDAVQSPGQTTVDLDAWGADFVVGAGHKWLLGPWGAGFLYVADDATAALDPQHVGYRSVADPNDLERGFAAGARRLEIGTASPAPHAGLAAAIECLDSVGFDTIEGRIERLTDRLKQGLDGDALLSPRAYESGLVTVDVDDPEATVERLASHDIRVRSLPSPDAIRVSVHAFNTAEDVDRLLSAV